MTQTPGPEQGQPEPTGSGPDEPTIPPPPPPVYDPGAPPAPTGWEQQQPQQGWEQPQPGYAPPPQQEWQQPQPGYGVPQPAYAGGNAAAPYGIHPGTGLPYSDKSKLVAGILQIFISGVGRMYIGQVGLGVAQLLVAIFTCGVGALWSIVDGILILTKDDAKDAQGRILKSS